MRWCVIVISLSLLGCIDEETQISTDGFCNSKVTCPSPLKCVNEGICALEGLPAEKFALQVSPPQQSEYRVEQWPLGESSQLGEIRLTPPMNIGGVVKEQGNPLAPSIPAEIILERPGTIPGTFLGGSTKAIEGVDENFNAFTFEVLPDELYRVYIYPDDTTRPPQVEEKVFLAGETDYLVSLPAKDGGFAYPRIIGSLLIEPSPDSDEALPLSNAQVFAVSRQSDDENNLNFISTEGSPDTKLGVYELRVSLAPQSYDIWAYTPVSAGALGTSLPFTKIGTCEMSGSYGEVAQIGETSVDLLPRFPILIRVESAQDKLPIDQVRFRLRNKLNEDQFSEWHGLSGEAGPGAWQGDITGGTYTMEVLPPRSSGFARKTIELTVGPEIPAKTIELELMTPVNGQLTGWGDAPIPNGRILFIRRDAPLAPPVEARADGNGTFSTILSPESYRTVVIPPENSPMPRWHNESLEVKDSEITGVWKAPYPLYIAGINQSTDGTPLEGAVIDVFDASSGLINKTLAEATLASTTSDQSGEFFTVIPSENGSVELQEASRE